MRDEERHRSQNPRVGEGYYYLQGRTPFWREPWPSNWKVTTPWKFGTQHDHRELQHQLKNLTLDVFNGDRESYPQWQSMFFKTVHVLDMDVDIKYNWLMRHITEDIKRELIRGISHSASKYCFAVSRLEQTYGSNGMEVANALSRLLSLKPFRVHETSKAVEFGQLLQGYICACDEKHEAIAVQSVMPSLLATIPREWLRDYFKWTQDERTEENPETLYAHLKPIIDTEKRVSKIWNLRTPSPTQDRSKFVTSKNFKARKTEDAGFSWRDKHQGNDGMPLLRRTTSLKKVPQILSGI